MDNIDGISIWPQKNIKLFSSAPREGDGLYSFLLVRNEDPALQAFQPASCSLVISGTASAPQYTAKNGNIRAGCTVHASFLGKHLVALLHRLILFKDTLATPFNLTTKQENEVRALFSKIEDVCASDYLYKKEFLKTLILQLVHYKMKNDPALTGYQ